MRREEWAASDNLIPTSTAASDNLIPTSTADLRGACSAAKGDGGGDRRE
jgi:hypothetical protein